jgi:predicted dienelactone hydrolase
VLASLLAAGAMVTAPAQADERAAIEEKYAATGPSAVSRVTVTDATGAQCEVFFPGDLGEGGRKHPILAYASGTGGTPDGAAPQVSHYASWGYVVTVSYSGATGFGNEAWACTQKAISDNAEAASQFFGKLDTGKVGAFGHSQGATGSVNATLLSGGVIKSTLPISLVNPEFHFPPEQLPHFNEVTTPVFLMAGSADFLTAPGHQQSYFDQLGGPAVRAMRKGADHNGIIAASNAYGVAWFKYTLDGDAEARGAFAGATPELNTNADWENQGEKELP